MFAKKALAVMMSACMLAGGTVGLAPLNAWAADPAEAAVTADYNHDTAEEVQQNRCYINGDEIRAYKSGNEVYVRVKDLSGYGFKVAKDGRMYSIEWGNKGYEFDEEYMPNVESADMAETAVEASTKKAEVAGKTVSLKTADGNLVISANDLADFGYIKYDSAKNIMNIYVKAAGYSPNDKNYRNITVDAAKKEGKLKALTGAHYDPGVKGSESAKVYIDAGINTIRTHDIDGVKGDGRGIIYNICPGYFDEKDQAKRDAMDLTDPKYYDFKELDKVIRNAKDIGAKIYFRFGASQNDVKDNTFPKEGTPEWDSYLKALSIVAKQIVKHYDQGWDHGMTDTLDYFEIWNEPDLHDFWPNTAAQYYAMYDAVGKAVKEVEADLPVGGPTLTTLNDDRGIEESFLKHVKESGAPLDFYSYHYYPSNNCDPYDYSRWANHLKQLLDKYGFDHVPMYLSEFGTVLFNDRAFSMDGGAEATYLTSLYTYLQDSPVSKALFYFRIAQLSENGSVTVPKTTYALKASSSMEETDNRVKTAGGDKNGFGVIAGINDNKNQINILMSNYEIPASSMLSNGLAPNPMIKDNKMCIPNVANWTLPIARVLTYENNAGYNLTVKNIPFNTKNVVVEQYRLDANNNLKLVNSKKVDLSGDGTITLSNALAAYKTDLLKVKAGNVKTDSGSKPGTNTGSGTTAAPAVIKPAKIKLAQKYSKNVVVKAKLKKGKVAKKVSVKMKATASNKASVTFVKVKSPKGISLTKTGKVVVKKGVKKGKYTLKFKMKAKGAKTVTKKVKVVVKKR
ncbi:MAG: hypothetical protein LKI32_02285 [Lachnospiraceae bacterium]|nr:hypothetical protein [Lachnospiraceae bacterium]MCI1656371.1 hypothetical protein [Lachnospiraceae bacterium]MCI2194853.1 hypothetical protein [Lachnospiraceae bacterium]